ncbi:MAG: hypothetical protein ACI4L6_03590 [Candidatus Onthoplasma sp.]
MTKKVNEIGTENMVRIKDEKVLSQLNEMYDRGKDFVYLSKNAFFNDVIRIGIQVLEKQAKDNWAIKNEKQTLLDTMHNHTKRMNYFIKFSKPFIQTAYADSEINQQLLCILLNHMVRKMGNTEREMFLKELDNLKVLPDSLAKLKKQLRANYLYEVE